jgi:hypothetical protein
VAVVQRQFDACDARDIEVVAIYEVRDGKTAAARFLPGSKTLGLHSMTTTRQSQSRRFERLFLCGQSLSAPQSIFTALQHPGILAVASRP